MRAAAPLLLVWRLAAGQEPMRPITVVVLPKEIRDSMSAIWSENNRHWDWMPSMNTPAEVLGASIPTRRYFGCLTGSVAGDTLRVRHIIPATGVKQRRFSVTGDCSKVADLIGTWHTHPYRAGFQGRAIKERELSGLDLKTFAATTDLVAIAMWDADSLDVATKGPEGMRHSVPYIIR